MQHVFSRVSSARVLGENDGPKDTWAANVEEEELMRRQRGLMG